MSNVQNPKSNEGMTSSRTYDRRRHNSDRGQAQLSPADVGHWTLDIGQLTVTGLRKAFLSPSGDSIEVLRGISFSAVAGETIAIVGVSGAGKSTLLHLIGGIEGPDHGGIRLGKFAVDGAGRLALARYRNRRVGFVFQFHHLLPDLTAAENISLPMMLARHERRSAMRR